MAKTKAKSSSPVSDDDEYTVERIIKKRISKAGTLEYYLKWKGWPESDNTWEPVEHLACEALLIEFEKNQLENKSETDTPKSNKSVVKTKRKTISDDNADSTASVPTTALLPPAPKEVNNFKKKLKGNGNGPTKRESTTHTKNTTQMDTRSCGGNEETEDTNPAQNEMQGFDRGLVPEKILGATNANGELVFLMKWEKSDMADLVLASTANKKCPQIVIQFYEERLSWHDIDTNKAAASEA
jgi:chromobox protein 5